MSEIPQEADVTIDTTGKYCPVPIIELAKAIKQVEKGRVVEVIATDPGVETDMPAWCKATRNELVAMVREGKVFRSFVRKLRE